MNDHLGRREEDAMLRFAYVPKTTKKFYAIRFDGRTMELPHIFRRVCIGYTSKEPGVRDIDVRTKDDITVCRVGDYIVLDDPYNKHPYAVVLRDDEFHRQFGLVSDLSFE